MSRTWSVALALSIALAPTAFAGTSPPGVNIRWDACFADGGAWNKTFACNTNTGSERLMTSVEVVQPKSDVIAIEVRIDVVSASAVLPAWWQFHASGTCRQTSLSMNTLPPADMVNCVDWGSGSSIGGIGAYSIGWGGPSHAKLSAVSAVPTSSAATLVPGTEYFIGRYSIAHLKTVGAGACAGCDVPVCIFFAWARLSTIDVSQDLYIDTPANWQGSQYVTWQNATPINLQKICETPAITCRTKYTGFQCVPYDVTPVRHSTWGQVKSLYR